jgi:deoxycytidine triphosphate deaminase
MFLNPQTAIDEGWVTKITNPELQVQPNAIDFTLDTVHTVHTQDTFIITEQYKQMRGVVETHPVPSRKNPSEEFWHLSANSIHDGISKMYVNLPEGVAALLIIRSTFNRNGIFLTSGLYDSGFSGHISFMIHNRSGLAKIGKGTRIGQIIFVESNNVGLYSGGWNHAEGTHHSVNN